MAISTIFRSMASQGNIMNVQDLSNIFPRVYLEVEPIKYKTLSLYLYECYICGLNFKGFRVLIYERNDRTIKL